MKFEKKPLTIPEQIALLESRGMIIANKDKAAHYLTNISYYRLSAYWYTFLQTPKTDHKFQENTTFEKVIDTYAKIQFALLDNLIVKASQEIKNNWVKVVKRLGKQKQSPIMFWRYSSLVFYDEVFKSFNQLPFCQLNGEEVKRIFDAYLIINLEATNRIKIVESELLKADEEGRVEDVTMANFIHQKDYVSTTELSNQITRGYYFLNYLESSDRYSKLVQEYYKSIAVSGHIALLRNLVSIFGAFGDEMPKRKNLIDLREAYLGKYVDLDYVRTISINESIEGYYIDSSFSLIRKKMLFRNDTFRFFLLDINFLIDQFYKAQVFAFYSFLKAQGIKDEFLSIKGKEFMEDIYLRMVMDACFPDYLRVYGNEAVATNGDELCDVYLRDNNKICLIEFKDVLLNADIKNDTDQDKLFGELDKKFVKNQKGKPKGITQLINAIEEIENNSVPFDTDLPNEPMEIYPVIIYTDATFEIEGLNKSYNLKFRQGIENLSFKLLEIKDITFISLSYFESHENYFSGKLLNLFDLINNYHEHIKQPEYDITTFEVFSRFYMSENIPEELGMNLYDSVITKISAL